MEQNPSSRVDAKSPIKKFGDFPIFEAIFHVGVF